MNLPLLFALLCCTGLGATSFNKLCSNIVVGFSGARYMMFFTVNGIVACIFFLFSGNFNVELNLPTFIYALLFAAVVAGSLVVSLFLLKLATITGVKILAGGFGLVATSATGFLLFNENVSPSTVIRIVIMLCAMACIFIEDRKSNKTDGKKSDIRNTVYLIAALTCSALLGCFATVITKFFAEATNVTGENSFFFWTNVILIAFSIPVFAVLCLRKKGTFADSVSLLRPRKLISLAGNTVCSNINSLVTVWILAQTELSVYTPISSALGILTSVVASLLFRERLGVFSYVAAAVACIAVII